MRAFLKRRWILLSFAVAGFIGSVTDVHFGPFTFFEGHLWFESYGYHAEEAIRFHHPMFGHYVTVIETGPVIALWLPLGAILGWIVIRELRWREKRARAKEAAATQ